MQNKEMRHQVVHVDKSLQTYGCLLTYGYIGTIELLVDSDWQIINFVLMESCSLLDHRSKQHAFAFFCMYISIFINKMLIMLEYVYHYVIATN